MSMFITADCISCAACEPECPNGAITPGDATFVINQQLCTECQGHADAPQCVTTCPLEGCIQQAPTA